jgi:hypothetical protein
LVHDIDDIFKRVVSNGWVNNRFDEEIEV